MTEQSSVTLEDTAASSLLGSALGAGVDAARPITRRTHVVQMLGDETGYRFSPARLSIASGDGVRFVLKSGGPHNVAFQDVRGEAAAALGVNMPEQMAPLAGKLLIYAEEGYTISFAGVPPGRYEYNCTPHAAMNMVGVITVH